MRAGFEVVGLPVYDQRGRQTGTVRDMLFDDAGQQVIGMLVERGRVRSRTEVIPFRQVQVIRSDAVIAGTAAAAALDTGMRADGSLQGKIVVSQVGQFLGTIHDVYFDEQTGAVHAYEVAAPSGAGAGPRRMLIPTHNGPSIGDVMVVPHPAFTPADAHPRRHDTGLRG